MSQAELVALEREVEQAHSRFASDLARPLLHQLIFEARNGPASEAN